MDDFQIRIRYDPSDVSENMTPVHHRLSSSDKPQLYARFCDISSRNSSSDRVLLIWRNSVLSDGLVYCKGITADFSLHLEDQTS